MRSREAPPLTTRSPSKLLSVLWNTFARRKMSPRHRPPARLLGRLEQLETRDVPTVEGLDIPAGHAQPRLWFTPERLSRARAWNATHPFTPSANSPLENAFVFQMTGNTTYADRAISDLLSFTISSNELAGTQSNLYRWGHWVPVVSTAL